MISVVCRLRQASGKRCQKVKLKTHSTNIRIIMGKRSKTCSTSSEIVIKKKKNLTKELIEVEPEAIKLKKKKSSDKEKQEKSSRSGHIDDSTADDNVNTVSHNRKRTRSASEANVTSQEISKTNENEKIDKNKSNNKKKSKKIVFVDDAPVEVATEPVTSDNKKTKNKNKQLPTEDEEVKDEDIDKFCDELTEEDNVQFDDWVKLIEAKLHAKK